MVRAFKRLEVAGKFDTTAEMNNSADVSSSADSVSSTVVSDGDLESTSDSAINVRKLDIIVLAVILDKSHL